MDDDRWLTIGIGLGALMIGLGMLLVCITLSVAMLAKVFGG